MVVCCKFHYNKVITMLLATVDSYWGESVDYCLNWWYVTHPNQIQLTGFSCTIKVLQWLFGLGEWDRWGWNLGIISPLLTPSHPLPYPIDFKMQCLAVHLIYSCSNCVIIQPKYYVHVKIDWMHSQQHMVTSNLSNTHENLTKIFP